MGNKAALVTVALAFALPVFADNPSNSSHKNTRTVAPKTVAPKNFGPKSGKSSNNNYESTTVHNTYSDPTVVNKPPSGGIGGSSWGTPTSKTPVIRKRNTGSGSISSATNALGPSN
jgi:hypothetical protein